MSEQKHMDLTEFRDEGYLQELNRKFLHPLGLALEAYVDENGKVTDLGGIWDLRDDPEGIFFHSLASVESKKKASFVRKMRKKFSLIRKERHGYCVQPVGHKIKNINID
jgi:hypothetical protein